MDGNGFDPFECVWSHEMAMRRLLSLLRQSQTYCTDNECLTELPGSDVNSSENFLFTYGWLVLAVILYFLGSAVFRRREGNLKFRDNERGSSGDSSAPPPLC